VLDLEFAEHAALPLGELPASQLHLRPNPDGSAFMLAVDGRILHGRLTGASWTLTELTLDSVPEPGKAHAAAITEAQIEVPDVPAEAAAAASDTHLRIIGQAPGLSLDPNQPNDAWTFPVGGEFEIVLNAVSVGGPAETGLYVHVYGAALEKGLLEPESVSVEGRNAGQATFEKDGKRRVARLPNLRIPAGVEPNKDKKIKPKERFLENPEDTFVTVRLRGKALAVGSDLLYVRVGFSGTEDGSLMRGRPVTVSSGAP
jgi:hypothetical protein